MDTSELTSSRVQEWLIITDNRIYAKHVYDKRKKKDAKGMAPSFFIAGCSDKSQASNEENPSLTKNKILLLRKIAKIFFGITKEVIEDDRKLHLPASFGMSSIFYDTKANGDIVLL